jgi:ABC-type iron transport system FetAB ATPase subunit
MLYNESVQFLRWENLSAILLPDTKNAQKFLLHDMSGEAKAGELDPISPYLIRTKLISKGDLVAIMGPSGSGKSMLLNRLAHRGMPPKAKLSGFVYINDSAVDMPLIRDTSSYVEQQDHLIGSITAKETLRFAARLGLKE